MKRPLKAAALTAALAGMMLAQRPFGALNTSGTSGTAPDPATIAAHQVARLTALLDLTTDQATQATTIFTNAQNSISALQTTIGTDETSLETAIKSNDTAAIDQLAAAIGTIEGQILDIRAKSDAAFYAILTSTQQAKLTTLGGLGGLGVHGGPGIPGGFGGGRHP